MSSHGKLTVLRFINQISKFSDKGFATQFRFATLLSKVSTLETVRQYLQFGDNLSQLPFRLILAKFVIN